VPDPPVRLPRPDPALGVFETLLVVDGAPLEIDEHLARLRGSLLELYGEELDPSLAARVRAAAAGCAGPSRLRVRWSAGALAIDTSPASPNPAAPVRLTPLVLPGGLGAHKWNDRRILADVSGEALIVDLTGEALETGAGALVLVEGERLISPPADGRILPSVTLGTLGEVAREPVTMERVHSADEVLVVSAIRRRQSGLVLEG
jgi:para-aminobenzoate synthetase / 4-amino-4-deoxychorismate lyase